MAPQMARALPRSAAAEDSDSASSSPAPVIDEAAAIAAERMAWEHVKDRLPGSEGHDEAQWRAWQAAVKRCRAARLALDRAGSQPHPPQAG